jgi:phage-related baseplate assembly protein
MARVTPRPGRASVQNAIQSVQQNLSNDIIENTLPNGTPQPGFFTVTIDDGSGAPPPVLINQVYAAIDLVRPVGSTFTVQPPAVIIASVNMVITALPGYDKPTVMAQVAQTIETFINNLGIGQALQYTRLSALAFGVTGVDKVSNVLLNNGIADIGGGPTQTVKATGASVVIN